MRQYEKEQQPYRKVKIFESIANAQTTISSYYESSTIAIEVSSKFNGNGNGNSESKNEGPLTLEPEDINYKVVNEGKKALDECLQNLFSGKI